MKVPGSVRKLYEEQRERAERLEKMVTAFLKPRLRPEWHYESRVKGEESFTLKLESGRVRDPNAVEDVLACWVVVRSVADIQVAENLIKTHFKFDSRRPPDPRKTDKRPECFPFDDVRLYVRWADDPALRPSGLDDCLFEVQIKTFLQHAWAIEAHDFVYKTSQVQWRRLRIAHQIKAMLEHAETSLHQAAQLSESAGLPESNPGVEEINEFIGIVHELWTASELPSDIRRLAENVRSLAKRLNVKPAELLDIMKSETEAGRGAKTLNLSPYGAIVQALLKTRRIEILKALKSEPKDGRLPLLIPAEVELPEGTDASSLHGAILLGAHVRHQTPQSLGNEISSS